MASSQKTQKASRWGFLQQAVASVESRLDTILAEEDEPPQKTVPVAPQQTKDNVSSNRPSAEIPRSGTSTPANDRLQARLAHAMAKKNASRAESPIPPLTDTQVEQNRKIDEEQSIDTSASADETLMSDQDENKENSVLPHANGDKVSAPSETPVPEIKLSGISDAVPSLEVSHKSSSSVRASVDDSNEFSTANSNRDSGDARANVHPSNLHSHLEAEASRQILQDEITEHKERIDTLQQKLNRLAEEARQTAETAASSAEPGSTERKFAEKEKAYALLTGEHITLQKTEMSLRTNNRKLQLQASSGDKRQTESKQRVEKVERSLRIMEDRARRAEGVAKRAEQSLSAATQATSDYEVVKRERDALSATIADIRAQLSHANQRADAAESRATTEQLDKERKRAADLQDDLRSAKVERELSEEKLRRDIKDLTSSLEREKEHNRAMETEMLGEQATLESKLESFRARAEEASSSDQGGVQAKLLRQIETLQSQYAAASQNWQGIESSLLTRITKLENERDEVASRESDVRRKLRETTSKLKRTERDLEDAQNRLPETEKLLGETEEENQRHQRKLALLDGELRQLRKEIEEQKGQVEHELKQRIEEERSKWTASLPPLRTESPVMSLRKGNAFPSDAFERGIGRRASPFTSTDTPTRQQSMASFRALSNGGGGVVETPSIVTSHDMDEYFNNVPATPASQSHANSPRAVHDLVSTSTVGAGPSVQLVERMSANVRRLESEKAASKDEIARLMTQRDESRQEVVDLMREVEEKRNAAQRLALLEEEQKALARRHQTTLELLGEKSELVDELKADIQDVKDMYRQLADTMGK